MVNKLIERSKKGVLIAKLSASKDSTTKIKGKSREIWLFIKQVWYVPFIWSLAWFSYWIFHDIVVLSQPIIQVNKFNYIGVTISISAILFAGYIHEKSNKKSDEKAGKFGIEKEHIFVSSKPLSVESDQESVFPLKTTQKTQREQSEELTPQLKNQSLIETDIIQKQNERSSEFTQPAIKNIYHNQENLKNQIKTSQEIPSDCLICPNLTNCDQRKRRTVETEIPCPYATANSKKKPI